MDDQEIIRKLKLRSSDDLINFRNKLKKLDTPRAWAIRFFIVQVLLDRYMSGED
jgi:hypothetical protein